MSGFRRSQPGRLPCPQNGQAGIRCLSVRILSSGRFSGNAAKPGRRRSTKPRPIPKFFRRGIWESALAAAQFPDILTDSRGTFHKPGST
jgi:hypothetical protein